ncbi:lysosomal alpha-mannosidase-like isoform X2 [Dermacentor albipictus]|uniref:lysosomal alpha-mannosidase-like isoform X2 n=1 Tax=Dermacentor albipictus TaxID=60249 RepID=UPI0038FBF3C0
MVADASTMPPSAAISGEAAAAGGARSGRPASLEEEGSAESGGERERFSLPLLVLVALDMRRDPVVQGLATMLLLSGMLSLVLCSALAGLQHRQAAQRERRHENACIYKACHETKPGFLNVHIVSHTHNDVGWVHTVNFYYRNYVRTILDSVVAELEAKPDRRFIYVEMAFFTRWWEEQTPEKQASVRALIEEGRLEFAGGGWCMNDEATTHYTATVDEMSLGLRWLNATFGHCGRSRVAWQIDPFGHARQEAALFAQMGFDGLFLGRIHLDDKEWRQRTKQMEFLWRADKYIGEKGDIFTGVLPNVYWPPTGFCFDVWCVDETLDAYNGQRRAREFLHIVAKQAKHYSTNHTVVTMGMDFHYRDAAKWFRNLDSLIHHINAEQANGSRVHAFYSTPACYLKALHDSGLRWPEFSDDFFPYADQDHAYWTGYYTSRPNFKYFARHANGVLQACKQLKVIGQLDDSADVDTLAKAVAVLQHHDAISGTQKQHVAEDYVYMTEIGIKQCEDVFNKAYRRMLLTGAAGTAFQSDICLTFCPLLNISSCEITETADEFFVFVYNPLSTPVQTYARLPVTGGGYEVKELPGQVIEAQLVPVQRKVLRIPERKTSTATSEIVFPMQLPPMGVTTYQLRKYEGSTLRDSESSAVFDGGSEAPAIDNGKYRLFLDPVTGLLSRVMLLNTGLEVPFRQSLFAYLAYEGVVEKPSGAYSFNPSDDQPIDLGRRVNYSLVKGPLVQEIHQTFSDWVSQVIRLYKDEDIIEFDWVVGPIPFSEGREPSRGKEIISRYQTSIWNNGTFYTDSNGRQTIKRTRNAHRPWTKTIVEPTTYNYYPVVSWIYLKNETHDLQLTVFPDRPQGGSSLHEGELELMLHRRLQYDDSFGVEEPLNEIGVDKRGLVARGTHRVFLGSIEDSERMLRSMANRLVLSPQFAFHTRDRELLDIPVPRASGLQYPLPPNLHLLTLEPVGGSRAIVRLEHLYPGVKDNRLNKPASVSLKNMLVPYTVTAAEETVLSAHEYLRNTTRFHFETRDSVRESPTPALLRRLAGHRNAGLSTGASSSGKNSLPIDERLFTVTVNPGEIRTFLVTLEPKNIG